MNIEVEIKSDTRRRVAAVAKRTGRSESQVIAEALEHGHSLEWQERFADKIATGIHAADSGDFASDAEVEHVRMKYRSA